MVKEEKNNEDQVITLEEIMEKATMKKIKEEDMVNLVLKCGNCGFRDLLFKFLRKKPEFSYGAEYFKIKGEKYKKDLFCPKCQSSLIVLDKKFLKNNFLKFL